MNALRTKSTVYKEKRAELSELRAESGVLARTCEVLNPHIWNWGISILTYGAGGFKLKYISGAEKQGDKSPAKPGSVGEGAGGVWVPRHNRELGARRGAEGRT